MGSSKKTAPNGRRKACGNDFLVSIWRAPRQRSCLRPGIRRWSATPAHPLIDLEQIPDGRSASDEIEIIEGQHFEGLFDLGGFFDGLQFLDLDVHFDSSSAGMLVWLFLRHAVPRARNEL
jgi:hypothetical protein